MAPRGETLRGEHALVTGGSRGIGAAITRALADQGATVTVVARDPDRTPVLARDMGAQGVCADVTRLEEVEPAFATAVRGSGPVTILVNNVGGVDSAPFTRMTPDMWQRTVDANLTATFLCCRQALPSMLESGRGRIVNIASTAGVRAYAYVSAYVAAKHAVIGLTRALALEIADKGVTVNAVCPGFADTDMTTRSAALVAERTGQSVEEIKARYAESNPHGRLVRPHEVADRVLWLCLPAQAEVTGRIWLVDGGELEEVET